VIWQQGKPPLDSELNFLQQLATDFRQIMTLRGTSSGFLGNGVNSNEDFGTNLTWSNWFRFGNQRSGEQRAIQWAVVNGWLVPVTGTQTGTPPGAPDDTTTWNRITLDPPPTNSGDVRIDFAFLEVWQARVPPNPSTDNKPASSAIYRYGNVEGGYTFLSDDLTDPALGFETTQRVQLQYRIRVVNGPGLTTHPDGFDPTVVKARGGATTDTAFTFENMREALGDPGLWRAGDGAPTNSLGTVDGYTYAVPICGVFRRNSVQWDGDPGQNLNGAFNRNPTAIDRTGWTTFSTVPTLAADIDDAVTSLTLVSSSNIALPAAPATPVHIKVGDEIMTYSAITGLTMTIAARGALGTRAEPHLTGDTIQVISGRPDGIFSDQIAKTDILDLRHVVNPNGFDYQTVLKSNLDKLLRGELRANWKRSGGGPQGPFVLYQDKISASAAALGVSKLDSPDNVRTTFSDAAVLQRVETIAEPANSGAGPSSGDATVTWGLQYTVTHTVAGGNTGTNFDVGDTLTIPVADLKGSLPGADVDQAKIVAQFGSVTLRIDGLETNLTESTHYSITSPIPSTESDDLEITLLGAFPTTSNKLYITFHALFGPSRGLSRRPDSLHSVAALSTSSEVLIRETTEPNNNQRLDTAWALLWSKYRTEPFQQLIPVTAGSYVDPGSRTVVVQPFRRIVMPQLRTLNGAAIHGSGGGLMPALDPSGGAKWTTPDPLDLFSNAHGSDGNPDIYVVLPRSLLPGWGAVHAPIRHTDGVTFRDGINFGILTNSTAVGGSVDDDQRNYIPFSGNITPSYTHFTTSDFAGGSVAFNTVLAKPPVNLGGMRFFDDTLSRNLGRKGLELPPFYGIARLFAVYEADDWDVNGDAYTFANRTFDVGPPTQATNLLRQDFDGPTFWIEIDADGDSTFILNADAIDITKSPNAIANFESGHYVITASIFGFTRDTFDVNSPARIVLTRERTEGFAASQDITGPKLVVPGPPPPGTNYVVNYSRTPYQGDPWGSQTTSTDIPHLQGPITTQQMFNVTSIPLDEENLTRPEQKTVEVLASIGFVTTLGTGRLSGDFLQEYDFLAVGREDHTAFPPATGTDPRPNLLTAGLDEDDADDRPLGTTYHGCTERLPLGATLRDANFKGALIHSDPSSLNAPPGGQLVYIGDHMPGGNIAASLATSTLEQSEVPVNTASISAGAPSDVLVHVDGEQGNYTLDTNFRTIRGGSLFMASGVRPGGEVGALYTRSTMNTASELALAGRAFLVRNTVTSVGATEVSAGDELMLLIQTTSVRYGASGIALNLFTLIGTNGTGEGDSAADLYRIEGHPLVKDNVRVDTDPNTVTLSRSITFINDI